MISRNHATKLKDFFNTSIDEACMINALILGVQRRIIIKTIFKIVQVIAIYGVLVGNAYAEDTGILVKNLAKMNIWIKASSWKEDVNIAVAGLADTAITINPSGTTLWFYLNKDAAAVATSVVRGAELKDGKPVKLTTLMVREGIGLQPLIIEPVYEGVTAPLPPEKEKEQVHRVEHRQTRSTPLRSQPSRVSRH